VCAKTNTIEYIYFLCEEELYKVEDGRDYGTLHGDKDYEY
jgi:hypothetical protein